MYMYTRVPGITITMMQVGKWVKIPNSGNIHATLHCLIVATYMPHFTERTSR